MLDSGSVECGSIALYGAASQSNEEGGYDRIKGSYLGLSFPHLPTVWVGSTMYLASLLQLHAV